MKRIILAAILGGLAMFVWDSLAHEVLPLGEAGLKALDNEQVLSALKNNVRESGFYVFPLPDTSGMNSAQRQAAIAQATERMRLGPAGIMVVYPQGREFVMPKSLATQFLSDALSMLLAGFLLAWSMAPKRYAGRVLFVTAMGLFPTLAMTIPMWNWYGFPTAYMLAQALTVLLAFLAGGLVVAALVRPRLA
jgi:hypothetical protein